MNSRSIAFSIPAVVITTSCFDPPTIISDDSGEMGVTTTEYSQSDGPATTADGSDGPSTTSSGTSNDDAATTGTTTGEAPDPATTTGDDQDTDGGPLCRPFSGFENGDFSQEDGWVLGDGVSLENGRLLFSSGAICFDQQAVQEVCVPIYEPTSEPLVLRAWDSQIDYSSCNEAGCEEPLFEVGYGPEPNLGYFAPLDTFDVCIGAAGHGGQVSFSLAASGACQAYEVSIDEVTLDLAGAFECPAPGEVLNGSFDESSGAGWVDVSPSAVFEIIDQGGSDLAGQFQIAGGMCNTARALARIAPPASELLASPGIRFSAVAAGREFGLGAQIIDTPSAVSQSFVVTEGAQELVFCLPPELAGGSYLLQLEVGGGGVCGAVIAGTLTIDDFQIASSPEECGP